MVRIKDVAEHAGVSTATVSRVINGKSVKPRFREMVERSVSELNFRPDRQARLLRLQRSSEVALIVPDIENPFYTALARGVIDVTRGAGYSAGLWNSDDLADKEDAYLAVVRDDKVAGIILVASTPNPRLKELMADGRAIVAVDRPITPGVDSVTLDNIALGRRGTADLVGRGYRRIACITGPATARTAVDRADGWRKEMRRHKLGIGGLLRRGNAHVDGGRAAAAELMAQPEPPDAILAANSLIGIGVLQVLDELRRRSIGLSVIGDLPFATSRPANTAIIPLSPRGLGETAAQMLIERIDGLRTPPRSVVQPVADPEALSWR
jgi:LacI family transcriptional regulator